MERLLMQLRSTSHRANPWFAIGRTPETSEYAHRISESSPLKNVLADRWLTILSRTAALLVIALCGTAFAANSDAGKKTKPSYQYTGDIQLDLSRVPFSRFGSYMT